ncbi:MAG: iron ABC transporter [Sphingomonadales bacterium 32-67-7]|nr:MAG: iron ABC transporter [Sphingomonadales bacterium 32-67-7]
MPFPFPRVLIGAAALLAVALGIAAIPAPNATAWGAGQGAGLAGGTPPAPRRIVSLNLCADQYLLALADRNQIAGLTHNADKPEMSAAADAARGLRILDQSAEEILALDPDLVIGKSVSRSPVMRALRHRHYRTLDLPPAQSFADIVAQIRSVAAITGHPARGEALIAGMERDLAALPRSGKGRVAAYYQRRGFLTGTGTLIDDQMRRAGLVNLAEKLGKSPLSRLSIEELVAARPDFIIIESATSKVVDQGTEMLHHPALRDIPRIALPQAWTVCGGPAYIRAAQSLAAQISAR